MTSNTGNHLFLSTFSIPSQYILMGAEILKEFASEDRAFDYLINPSQLCRNVGTEITWMEVLMVCFKVLSQHLPEKLRKATKSFGWNN